jgi:hypothetical protein
MASVLMLAIFIYNTFGFLTIYPILSNYYKYLGMRCIEKLSNDALIETLIFDKEDILNKKINFQWIHSREFKYNGEMYDIVEKKETKSHLIFYCVNDEKEKEFEKQFEKKLEDNLANKKQKSAKNNLINLLISEAVSYISNNSIKNFKSIHRLEYTMNYNSISRDIPSPPPKSFLFA